jgi:hypothetical protein
MRRIGVLRVGCAALLSLALGGCEALGSYEVHTIINAAHHGMRGPDGKLPSYGEEEKARVFVNDLGWTITLSDGFVVTTAARLETCEGEQVDVTLPFGPFPEYWLAQDKNVEDFAQIELAEGEYCRLIVEYGRYRSDVASMAEDEPFPVRDLQKLADTTLYLGGYADRPDGNGGTITHSFSFRTDQTVRVELDLSTLGKDGTPWRVSGDELSSLNLTVLKTYDVFFQGVDFDALDVPAIEAKLPQMLADNTTIISGTSVY